MTLLDVVEGAPRPQLRLGRVVLWGIGPPGARFDPLELDLTGFDGTAADRALLSLTNTGGKSTLITLLSSVIVPSTRDQVGHKNLGDYLLTGDTGHVVCQWDDDSRGTRVVTGVVMEWRNGKVQPPEHLRSAAAKDMHRTWYVFATGEDLPGVEDLPFLTADDRRSTHEQFTAALGQMFADHPAMRGAMTSKQSRWAADLEARTSLDPVLFTYQMRMNDSEAGADELLKDFGSPEAVVRFFVGALNDAEATKLFTDNLAKYAEVASKRPELEALTGFCGAVLPAIGTVADRAEEDRAARLERDKAATTGDELAAAFAARVANDTAELETLVASHEAASEEAARLRGLLNTIPDIRAQLRLEAARERLRRAEEDLEIAQHHHAGASAEAEAWAAVEDVTAAQGAAAALQAARKALDAADRGLDPLRIAVDEAAGALGARLDTLVNEARQAESDAKRRQDDADGLRRDAAHRAKKAQGLIFDTESKLRDDRRTIAAADAATEEAISRNALRAGEDVQAAVRRWADAYDSAQEVQKRALAEASAADDAYDTEDGPLRSANAAEKAADATLSDAEKRADRFVRDLARFAEDPAMVLLLDATVESPPDLRRVVELADEAAGSADLRAADAEKAAAEADRELAHLAASGTARTNDDVVDVVKVLDDARIGATTGLEWIERNVADAEGREAFIATRPDVAGGVIVTDPARFGDAISALTGDRRPTLRSPVVVTTAPSATAGAQDVPQRHVVVPHRATWDREWAERARDELEEALRTHRDAARAARDAAAAHRDARSKATSFLATWPEDDADTLATAVEAARGALAERVAAREAIEERRATYRAEARRHRAKAATARDNERRAGAMLRIVEGVAQATEAAEAARGRREHLEADLLEARAELGRADDDQEQAARDTSLAASDAEAARGQAARLATERKKLAHPSAPVDPGGNLEVLTGAYLDAQQRLTDAAAGLPEAQQAQLAERAHAKAADRLSAHSDAALERAEVLAGTLEADSPDMRRRQVERARGAANDAQRRLLQVEVERNAARKAAAEAGPVAPRTNHADLSRTPEWSPQTPADIPALLERLDRHAEDVRRQVADADREVRDAEELRHEVEADIRSIGDSGSLWRQQGATAGTVEAYTGPREDARTLMKAAVETFSNADDRATGAAKALTSAVAAVRAFANDERWANAPGVLPVRLRRLSDEDLVAEAATLAGQVDALKTSADGDLANLDKHRTILRDSLIQLCDDQRSLLRDVSAQSRLPEGLDGLSGQHAIKITFTPAPPDEAASRLAHRIDTWALEIAENPKRASSSEVRVRWLAAAVGDTVVDRPRAGRFGIEVLKPTLDGRPQYCGPARIPSEFSGGQVLTLAVLVYCALSKVRSTRRTSGARPAGTLLLDNPFGAASAEPLIAMQHRLAVATGVQLVCATGLHDPAIEAAFSRSGSVIAKLHNDGDLRRNLRHLRLMATVVDGIDVAAAIAGGRDTGDDRNWVRSLSYRTTT